MSHTRARRRTRSGKILVVTGGLLWLLGAAPGLAAAQEGADSMAAEGVPGNPSGSGIAGAAPGPGLSEAAAGDQQEVREITLEEALETGLTAPWSPSAR